MSPHCEMSLRLLWALREYIREAWKTKPRRRSHAALWLPSACIAFPAKLPHPLGETCICACGLAAILFLQSGLASVVSVVSTCGDMWRLRQHVRSCQIMSDMSDFQSGLQCECWCSVSTSRIGEIDVDFAGKLVCLSRVRCERAQETKWNKDGEFWE